jgi:hypothetical protein
LGIGFFQDSTGVTANFHSVARLVAGDWLLVARCWLLVARCWLLVAGNGLNQQLVTSHQSLLPVLLFVLLQPRHQVPRAQTCDTEAGDCYAIGDRHRQKKSGPGGAAQCAASSGNQSWDRLEFKASRGVITILTKSNNVEDEYTSEQRRMIDRAIARGLEDIKKGRVHGPFTAPEATEFIKTELKTRTKKRKTK